MKKNIDRTTTIVALAAIILIILGIAFYSKGKGGTGQNEPQATSETEGSTQQVPVITDNNSSEQDASSTTNPDTPAKNGYIKLSDYQAETAAYNQGNVVLFFNASWCPTCKVLNQSLHDQAAQFPNNLTVVDVDYDKESELKSKYQVQVQHTLVQIDADGNQVAKWVGGGDLQSILQELK